MWGGGPVGGWVGSGQGGTGVCVRRIQVIEKMQKKKLGGRGFQLVARLGVVGDVQYWVCKPRIEGIVICT